MDSIGSIVLNLLRVVTPENIQSISKSLNIGRRKSLTEIASIKKGIQFEENNLHFSGNSTLSSETSTQEESKGTYLPLNAAQTQEDKKNTQAQNIHEDAKSPRPTLLSMAKALTENDLPNLELDTENIEEEIDEDIESSKIGSLLGVDQAKRKKKLEMERKRKMAISEAQLCIGEKSKLQEVVKKAQSSIIQETYKESSGEDIEQIKSNNKGMQAVDGTGVLLDKKNK